MTEVDYLTPVETEDRRVFPRIEAEMTVWIANGLRSIKGNVMDVSVGGAHIEWADHLETIDQALEVGQFVEIDAGGMTTIPAIILRIEADSIGIRFDIPDSELSTTIQDINSVTGMTLVA